MWKRCREHEVWSVFGKRRRGKGGRPGPPVFEGWSELDFTVQGLSVSPDGQLVVNQDQEVAADVRINAS